MKKPGKKYTDDVVENIKKGRKQIPGKYTIMEIPSKTKNTGTNTRTKRLKDNKKRDFKDEEEVLQQTKKLVTK
jgi:hypothetical protein